MLEERRHLREQTPRRKLDKKNYQPRRLVGPDKIELGLPKTAWTPHRHSALHKIYPIPEDEGEGRSSGQQSAPRSQENRHNWERTSGPERQSNPPTLKVKVQEEVQELQEEEEEEIDPVIPVGTKDQTRAKVWILKKRMIVVSLPPD